MIKRTYQHKDYICECHPNFAPGDELAYSENGEPNWENLPNHKDPRNEWSVDSFRAFGGVCLYCDKKMVKNPRAGELEIIKNGRRGSWQTNKPKGRKQEQ